MRSHAWRASKWRETRPPDCCVNHADAGGATCPYTSVVASEAGASAKSTNSMSARTTPTGWMKMP